MQQKVTCNIIQYTPQPMQQNKTATLYGTHTSTHVVNVNIQRYTIDTHQHMQQKLTFNVLR